MGLTLFRDLRQAIDGVGGSFGPELVNAVQRGVRIKLVAGLNSYIPAGMPVR